VKIGGVTYTGGISKSKKEAEIKAAKTALIAICSDPGLFLPLLSRYVCQL
jgi:dsRNA-specific ribonuclease